MFFLSKTSRLAELIQAPSGYLPKVLHRMSEGGLVRAQRRLHGGFSLGRSPSQITVLDVLKVIEPMPRTLGLTSHGVNLCPLHRQLDHALASIEYALAAVTLAQLLNEPAAGLPLRKRVAEPPASAQ